jgi:Skp family chaperone for outer membrane proteins
MLEIIQQIGQERGYGLVIDNPASQLNAIVLYKGTSDDITEEVITRLSAQLKQNESK